MSSYFDQAARAVADASAAHDQDAAFLNDLVAVENRVADEIKLLCGDREFPVSLRQQILGVIAIWQVRPPAPLHPSERGRTYAQATRLSRLIQELHTLFHVVAGLGVRTRFGVLSDDPAADLRRRDEHDR